MRRAETQRTLVRERETQIRSKGRKRNALRGTAECRLRAVMLLMLFLCASQSTSSYVGFSPGPLPYGTIPIPCRLLPSWAPRCKPDLLVFSIMPSDKSWDTRPAMIRLQCAERQGEEKGGDRWIGKGERGGG